MNKNSFCIKLLLLVAIVSILSCKNNEDDKKAPDITKPAVENADDSAKKYDTATVKKTDGTTVPESVKIKATKKDSSASAKIKTAEKKTQEKKTTVHDTAAITSSSVPVSKKDNAPANTTATSQPATQSGNKPFVSKYGIIPRNATESNLTVFYNTFPDKHTLIKVNFDGPADAEMNSVKAQIIQVLKKSGYMNVSDHSETIEPKRMPKDIHYELQHDGSVVFWVPIANQEQ